MNLTKCTHLQWLYILGGAVNQKGNCKSLLQLCHPLPRIRHFGEVEVGGLPWQTLTNVNRGLFLYSETDIIFFFFFYRKGSLVLLRDYFSHSFLVVSFSFRSFSSCFFSYDFQDFLSLCEERPLQPSFTELVLIQPAFYLLRTFALP